MFKKSIIRYDKKYKKAFFLTQIAERRNINNRMHISGIELENCNYGWKIYLQNTNVLHKKERTAFNENFNLNKDTLYLLSQAISRTMRHMDIVFRKNLWLKVSFTIYTQVISTVVNSSWYIRMISFIKSMIPFWIYRSFFKSFKLLMVVKTYHRSCNVYIKLQVYLEI